jgi:flagellar motor switch protein FliN/FliY
MALISNLPISEVAAVVARGIEALIGHDVVIGTGTPELGPPSDATLPDGPTRTIVLPFSDGVIGEVSLVVSETFAMTMEAATDDASLTTAAVSALDAGAAAIAFTIAGGVPVGGAGEISTETLLTSVVGDFAAVSLHENETRIGCVVVRVVDEIPVPAAAPTIEPDEPFVTPSIPTAHAVPAAPSMSTSHMPPLMPVAPQIAAAPIADPGEYTEHDSLLPAVAAPRAPGIAVHEFQPLNDGHGTGAAPRPLTLLNDVHVQITAELGRRRLKVRDIVALEPGSVIELDRAAGSPVDVLVNGALVWHGEVVVVDEEFGIRVAEIVVDEN